MALRVLPGLTVTAATRFSRRLAPSGRTLSPCSQLHARPAETIADPAGGLLPHRFSPHPCTQRSSGGYSFCCGCSHTPVTRCTPPLAVSWGNRPVWDRNPHTGRESGSSSDHRSLERNRPPATAVVRHFRLLSCDSQESKPESLAPRTSINIPRRGSAVKLTTSIFYLRNRPQMTRI